MPKPKKKDTSAHVQQRAKINFDLQVHQLNWTDKQRDAIDLIRSKETRIVLLKGPAGSSKTSLAMYSALQMLSEKRVSDIVMVRSAVESSDSKLGF